MTPARLTALLCALAVAIAGCAAPLTLAGENPGSTTTSTTRPVPSSPPPTSATEAACKMTPPLPPEDPPAPSADPSEVAPTEAERARIAAVQSQTQELRGLPQAAVPVEFLKSDEVTPTLERYKTDRDRANVQKIDPLAKQIGWVEESSTTEAEMAKLQQGLILGFFIPSADTLWIVQKDGSDLSPLQQSTLSHEWVHALQNAAFDLEKRDEGVPQFDLDRASASSALYEGDASVFEDKWTEQFLTPAQRREKLSEELDIGLPDDIELGPLVGDLMMPYIQGPKFVEGVLASGGAPPLSTVYARPPQTTTEILHPDKYLAGFKRADIGLGGVEEALGDGWTQTIGGTWGEYSSAMLMAGIAGQAMPDDYLKSVPGWQGDCLGFWQDGDGRFGAIATKWVDAAAARNYVAGFEKALARARATKGPGGFFEVDEDHLWKVTADGDTTMLIFTNDKAAAEATADLGGATGGSGGSVL